MYLFHFLDSRSRLARAGAQGKETQVNSSLATRSQHAKAQSQYWCVLAPTCDYARAGLGLPVRLRDRVRENPGPPEQTYQGKSHQGAKDGESLNLGMFSRAARETFYCTNIYRHL